MNNFKEWLSFNESDNISFIERFISSIGAKPNPFSNRSYYYQDGGTVVKFFLSKGIINPNSVYIDELHTVPNKTGAGRRFLDIITKMADETNTPLELDAVPLKVSPKIPSVSLINFYKSFGFKVKKGYGKMMVRLPNQINESVRVEELDLESDWDTAAKIDEIANEVGIRFSRNKNIYIAAFDENDKVVGGVAASLEQDHELSEEEHQNVGVLSFDVVVSPRANPMDMIGVKLIKEAEKLRNYYGDYFDKIIIKNEVINGKLAKIMQHPKMGYSPKEGEYNQRDNRNLYKH